MYSHPAAPVGELVLGPTKIYQGSSLIAQSVKNLPARQETWVRFLGLEDPLKKEMETHSSILAWRIPWTEEPGRLESMGLRATDTIQRLSHHQNIPNTVDAQAPYSTLQICSSASIDSISHRLCNYNSYWKKKNSMYKWTHAVQIHVAQGSTVNIFKPFFLLIF